MALLVGLDIGTTSTIGVLIDADGRTLAERSRPVRLLSLNPGWAEEEPEEWWANSCAILGELAEVARGAGDKIAAVGVTGMVPAVVLLDERDRVLRRSIQQSDGRTSREVEALRASVDPDSFFRRTGCGINQQLVAPKLRWLERHEPEAFGRIRTVFGSYDYVTFRLTGAKSVEHNWALESGLMELETRRFAEDLVALGGVSPSVLPPIRASHEIVGTVAAEAEAATGLPAGIPVIAGCADHVASAFVAGIFEEGDVLLKFGGAGDILAAMSRPPGDPRLFLDFHVIPGLFMPNGCMAASGSVLNWIVRELGGRYAAEKRPHAALDRDAERVPPGADGLVLLPYFLGEKTPIHDPLARGFLLGLGLHHTLPHVWRAALEGIAFGFRHHVEVFAEAGMAARRFVASDGGANSALWMHIAADILQAPVQLIEGHPGSSLGAAFVAGYATGAFSEWTEINRYVRPGAVVRPDPANAACYDRLYRVYREAYGRLKPVFPMLADTVEGEEKTR